MASWASTENGRPTRIRTIHINALLFILSSSFQVQFGVRGNKFGGNDGTMIKKQRFTPTFSTVTILLVVHESTTDQPQFPTPPFLSLNSQRRTLYSKLALTRHLLSAETCHAISLFSISVMIPTKESPRREQAMMLAKTRGVSIMSI